MEIAQKIVDKANELFSTHGIRNINMDEIASNLGMSKKTIYRFFNSKEDIVLAVTEQQINNCKCTLEAISSAGNNAIAELFYVISHVYEYYKQIAPSIIHHDLENYYPRSYNILTAFRDVYLFETIRSVIISGKNNELFRDNFNLNTIVTYIINSVAIIPAVRSVDDNVYPGEIFDLLVSGITTIHGAEILKEYRDKYIIVSMTSDFRTGLIWDH